MIVNADKQVAHPDKSSIKINANVNANTKLVKVVMPLIGKNVGVNAFLKLAQVNLFSILILVHVNVQSPIAHQVTNLISTLANAIVITNIVLLTLL